MAEPEDAVMPILQKIQKELSDFRKASEAKANNMAETLLDQGKKLDEIESLLTYHLGLTTQHGFSIKNIEANIQAMELRLTDVEKRP